MGESTNTLFSDKQMEENGFLVHKTEYRLKYIEAYGFIIRITVKEAIQYMNIFQPTKQ